MSIEEFEGKDISQSTDITDLAEVLRELNPDVEIKLGDVDTDPQARERIYSSKPVEELKLPKGFEYNEKNGITNKHNTETGAYMSAKVEGLEPIQSKDISQSTDITDLAEVLRELNPDVEIKLGDVNTDPQARERIYSSKPVEELKLPKGFEYNEKNGITNKHNTETGAYMSARVEGLEPTQSKDISQSTDITDLAGVLRELNPDVEIKLGDVNTDPQAGERIYSSKPVGELKLPQGFDYNEKNGITNKHNTETGAYMSVKVETL